MKTKNHKIMPGILFVCLIFSLSNCPLSQAPEDEKYDLRVPGSGIDVSDLPFFEPASEAVLQAESIYGYVIVKTAPDFDQQLFEEMGVVIIDHFSFKGWQYYYLHKEKDILPLLENLKHVPGVIFAEPDSPNELHESISYPSGLNDPLSVSAQYSARITGLRESLETFGIGKNEVYVAVIDSGINWQHEDFQGVIQHGFSMFSKNAAHEYTFVGYNNTPILMDNSNWDINPKEGHGSHVAGILAASGNNARGVIGFCPDNVKLIMYKCFAVNASGERIEGYGSDWSVYGSLKHLTDLKIAHGISQTLAVNLSLGSSRLTKMKMEMLNYAMENNILVIASAGNTGGNVREYPAAVSGVLAVGSTDGRDQLSPYSNTGAHLSVTAPGQDILSIDSHSDSGYVLKSGTSMSAPAVTGLAAYMLTFDPELTPAEIKTLLEENADDLGAPGYDETYGHGRINVLNTIAAVKDHVENGTPINTASTGYKLTARVFNIDPQATGPIPSHPVYLYDSNGQYLFCALTSESGEVSFLLLPAGNYMLTTNYYNKNLADGSAPAVAVDFTHPTADVVADFAYNVPLYNIQALHNGGNGIANKIGETNAAVGIYLYASDRKLLASKPYYANSLSWPLESGHSYYLKIEPVLSYTEELGEFYSGGDYSLHVSQSYANQSTDAAALSQDPLVDEYEPNDTFDTATVINIDTYYHNFLSEGQTEPAVGVDLVDYFQFSL